MHITKEEWLKIRNEEELPLRVFWSFFDDKKPNKITLTEFEQAFPKYAINHQMLPYPNTAGNPCRFSMQMTLRNIYEHFDKKFGI